MLAVPDAAAAAAWYKEALGATELWNLGTIVGLEVRGAALFLAQPGGGWRHPEAAGCTMVRVEVFLDDPDPFIARAVRAGAKEGPDGTRDHQRPWGRHRQGGFTDPFGHIWLVGDKSPLVRHPA
jgi:uncharacterized glyoxalase superfamily protein PhnB